MSYLWKQHPLPLSLWSDDKNFKFFLIHRWRRRPTVALISVWNASASTLSYMDGQIQFWQENVTKFFTIFSIIELNNTNFCLIPPHQAILNWAIKLIYFSYIWQRSPFSTPNVAFQILKKIKIEKQIITDCIAMGEHYLQMKNGKKKISFPWDLGLIDILLNYQD